MNMIILMTSVVATAVIMFSILALIIDKDKVTAGAVLLFSSLTLASILMLKNDRIDNYTSNQYLMEHNISIDTKEFKIYTITNSNNGRANE